MIFEVVIIICLIALIITSIVLYFVFNSKLNHNIDNINVYTNQLDNKINVLASTLQSQYVSADQYVPIYSQVSGISRSMSNVSSQLAYMQDKQNKLQTGGSSYHAITFS